jgi:hypothetical protein
VVIRLPSGQRLGRDLAIRLYTIPHSCSPIFQAIPLPLRGYPLFLIILRRLGFTVLPYNYLLFCIKMHQGCRWLHSILSFSAKSDICICEWPVFAGESHLIFFSNGAMWPITSLKNEKPVLFRLVCRVFFSWL